jgi:ankyrin repeat protein
MTPDWKAAVRAEDTGRLEALLRAGADINARDEHGQTAIMIAARDGRTEAPYSQTDPSTIAIPRCRPPGKQAPAPSVFHLRS